MPPPSFAALDDPNARKPKDFGVLGDVQPPAGAPGAIKPPGDLTALGAPQQPVGAPAAPKTPPAPVGAPVAPAAAPAAPAAPIDPNQVWGSLQAQFQAQHGHAMTPQEAQALQSYAGYTAGSAINQGMIDRAKQGVGSYTGDINNPFGGAPGGTPAAPTAPVDPGIATGDLAQQQLQQLLMTGSTDGMTLDMNNPAIRAQQSHFDRLNSRQTTQDRFAAAERGAARGTAGSGGFDADLAGAQRDAGDRASGFQSQMMSQELQGQRARVMQALQMADASGNQAQSRALSERLGTLDAQIRREGQGIQDRLGQGQLGLGLLQALMGDRRAGDALGFNYASLGQQGNSDLMRMILGASQ